MFKELAAEPHVGMIIDYTYAGKRGKIEVTRLERVNEYKTLVYYVDDMEGKDESYLVLDSGWAIMMRQVIRIRNVHTAYEPAWEV